MKKSIVLSKQIFDSPEGLRKLSSAEFSYGIFEDLLRHIQFRKHYRIQKEKQSVSLFNQWNLQMSCRKIFSLFCRIHIESSLNFQSVTFILTVIAFKDQFLLLAAIFREILDILTELTWFDKEAFNLVS